MQIKLAEISPTPPKSVNKKWAKKQTENYVEKIKELQKLLYANEQDSLLVVLQGMDASGKDGVLRDVFSGVNPLGCRVHAFKKPTDLQMAHDFLWRVHQQAPEKGMIQIFNRSHYEDVLIQRVHQWIDIDQVKRRFNHINNFEQLLQDNGTHILKFYLHISKESQLADLKERMVNPKKMWKHNDNDMKERARWDEYMAAYEDVLKNCGSEIPWQIIPSDSNWYKEYLISKAVCEKLESLEMEYPRLVDNGL